MDAPPEFGSESRAISEFRRSMETSKLASMEPMEAKASVASWHSDVQSLTSKLAAQLTYSR